MEAHASPFAFLLVLWAGGLISSFIFGVLSRVLLPAREIEDAFK